MNRGGGMNARLSRAYVCGMIRGYRLAGRSLPRRMLGTLLVAAVLWGSGIAFLWASADVFFRLSTGETAAQVVIGKFAAWNFIHGR